MKKIIIVIASTAIVLTSCVGGVVEKRKHRTGFHWNGLTSSAQVHAQNRSSKVEPEEIVFSEINELHTLNNEIQTTVAEASPQFSVPSYEINNIGIKPKEDTDEFCEAVLPLADEVQNINTVSGTKEDAIFTDSAEKQRNRNTFALFLALAGIGVGALWMKKKDKKLGSWALENRQKAKWVIAGLQIGLATDAYLLGKDLASSGIEFNYNGAALALGGMATVTGISFLNKKKQRKWGRNRLTLTVAPLIIAAAYLNPIKTSSIQEVSSTSFEKHFSHLSSSENQTYHSVYSKSVTEDSAIQSKGLNRLKKFFLVLSAVIAIVAIVILSCAAACAGYTYIPLALLFIGLPSIIILLVGSLKSVGKDLTNNKPSFGKIARYALLALGAIGLILLIGVYIQGNLFDTMNMSDQLGFFLDF